MKKWIAIFLCACSVGLLIPSGVRAQAGATGAITGTVLDEKGGAISHATIAVINRATGQEKWNVTGTGAEKVLVQVTETASVTATLQIGQVTESVFVHDVTTPVNLTSATTGETISAGTASTLPLFD